MVMDTVVMDVLIDVMVGAGVDILSEVEIVGIIICLNCSKFAPSALLFVGDVLVGMEAGVVNLLSDADLDLLMKASIS